MLNLVSAANASDKAILWGFLSALHARARRRETEPLLDRLAGYAINYYEDFVAPDKALPRARPIRSARPCRTSRPGFSALPAGLPGRRGDPERGLRGRQGRRVRAAARLVPGALRGAAGPEPGAALRLLRRHLRAGPSAPRPSWRRRGRRPPAARESATAGSAARSMTRLATAMTASASASGASKTSSSCTCSSIRAFRPAAFSARRHADHGAADDVGGGALDRGVDRRALGELALGRRLAAGRPGCGPCGRRWW